MNDKYAWLRTIKAHGWENIFSAVLDVLEPFGALGAQALWVLQPALSILVSREALGSIAQALEEPDELQRLREELFLED
ncbi:MAG: hypothetical protein U0694_23505 [Anaerolineae bacterium]